MGKSSTQSTSSVSRQLAGVLFDWDGTIVDSAQAMFLSYRHAYEKHLGILLPRDNADFRMMVPMRIAESSAKFGGKHAADVANSYNEYYEREAYKTGRIFPGMREALAELRRRGYLLGVASNKSLTRISADIEYLGLQNIVDVLVTSEDTVERKPHPAPLLKAAEKLGREPEMFAYVGDYRGDLISARAAGMVSVAVSWGGMFLLETLLAEEPDYVVETPEHLLDIFGPLDKTEQVKVET